MGKSTKFIIRQSAKIKKIVRIMKVHFLCKQLVLSGGVVFAMQYSLSDNNQAGKYFADSLQSVVILVLILQSRSSSRVIESFFAESLPSVTKGWRLSQKEHFTPCFVAFEKF